MNADRIIDLAKAAGRSFLSEPAAKSIVAGYGIPIPRHRILAGAQDVTEALGELRSPFALKVVSSRVNHKSDVGGVRLGLVTASEIDAAMKEIAALPSIRDHAIDGFLLEEMAPKGIEIVIGGIVDESFGPAVMVGLGGIFVEVLEDVSFRLCPITRTDAREMIDELRGRRILSGVRGAASANIGALVEALMGVGGENGLLCALRSRIRGLDINPLIASADGAVAVDARIILRM